MARLPIVRLQKSAYSISPGVASSVSKGGLTPGIQIFSYVSNDEVTPAVTMAEKSSHPLLKLGMYAAAQKIKQTVAKAYESAQGTYTNSPTTMTLKGGKRALEDSGKLKEAMTDTGGIIPYDDGVTVKMSISWDIPEAGTGGVWGSFRKNQRFEYLWVHEFGASMNKVARPDAAVIEDTKWQLQARPFFLIALNDARQEAAMAVAAAYAPVIDSMQNARLIRAQGLGIKLTPSLWSTSATGMLAYFIPPSIMYAYLGAFTDIMGAWSGSLLSQKQMFGWSRQYLWGQVGATKKTIRRKFRRRLWT